MLTGAVLQGGESESNVKGLMSPQSFRPRCNLRKFGMEMKDCHVQLQKVNENAVIRRLLISPHSKWYFLEGDSNQGVTIRKRFLSNTQTVEITEYKIK